MRAFSVTAIAVAVVLSAGHAFAQAQGQIVAPAAGCKATPAELEATKKVAMAFFAPNADRVALADPSSTTRHSSKAARKPASATTTTSNRASVDRGRVVRVPARAAVRRRRRRVLSPHQAIPSRS